MNNRRQAITDVVNQLGEVSIHELKGMFPNVSEVTLRKDLQSLYEENKLLRIHGGARSIQDITANPSNYNMRQSLNQAEKALIGEKAVKLLSPGMAVFISSGSTCAEMAKRLPRENLQIFTDGVSVALSTPAASNIKVELLGGELNRNLMRITGPLVIGALDGLYFDYAFLGTMGFNPQYGFALAGPMIAAASYKAVEHSRKTVILMDSSKVNDLCTPRNIPLSSIDIVVSDGNLPESAVQSLESAGITVL